MRRICRSSGKGVEGELAHLVRAVHCSCVSRSICIGRIAVSDCYRQMKMKREAETETKLRHRRHFRASHVMRTRQQYHHFTNHATHYYGGFHSIIGEVRETKEDEFNVPMIRLI